MNREKYEKLCTGQNAYILTGSVVFVILIGVLLFLLLPLASASVLGITAADATIWDFLNSSNSEANGVGLKLLWGVILMVLAVTMLLSLPTLLLNNEVVRLNWFSKKTSAEKIERMKNTSKNLRSTLILVGFFFVAALAGGIALTVLGLNEFKAALVEYSSYVSVSLGSGAISFLVLAILASLFEAAFKTYVFLNLKNVKEETKEEVQQPAPEEISTQQTAKEVAIEEPKEAASKEIAPKEMKAAKEAKSVEQKQSETSKLDKVLDSGVLIKLKQLLDEGVITQEDYDQKKKELLDL